MMRLHVLMAMMLFCFFSMVVLGIEKFQLPSIQDQCFDHYANRGEDKSSALNGIECYEKMSSNELSLEEKSYVLNQLAYLYIFRSVYESENKNQGKEFVNKSEKVAKQASEIFGSFVLNDFQEDANLSNKQVELLSHSLYLYGLSLARSADINGTAKALKVLPPLIGAMKKILKLKKTETAHFGAFRNLALIEVKSPLGNKKKAMGLFKNIFRLEEENRKSLCTEDVNSGICSFWPNQYQGVSSYPINNFEYAKLLFLKERKSEACQQLTLIKNLGEEDLENLMSHYIYESKLDIVKAEELFRSQCL